MRHPLFTLSLLLAGASVAQAGGPTITHGFRLPKETRALVRPDRARIFLTASLVDTATGRPHASCKEAAFLLDEAAARDRFPTDSQAVTLQSSGAAVATPEGAALKAVRGWIAQIKADDTLALRIQYTFMEAAFSFTASKDLSAAGAMDLADTFEGRGLIMAIGPENKDGIRRIVLTQGNGAVLTASRATPPGGTGETAEKKDPPRKG